MAACTGYDMYRSNHFEGMDPKRLILMLYDGALKHIRLAREGVDQGDIRKRGENLGKVIAIVSELNACLDNTIHDESVDFLRGLYMAILMELPKVSINNDIRILDRSYGYIERLRAIWEKDVMGEKGGKKADTSAVQNRERTETAPIPASSPGPVTGYHAYNGKSTSVSV